MKVHNVQNENLKALVYNGQIVSLQNKGEEYIHGGGKPEGLKYPEDRKGWQNSGKVMFPIVGSVNNHIVTMNGREYFQDQHGLAYLIASEVNGTSEEQIRLIQHHWNGSMIENPKYSEDNSRPMFLAWPDFRLERDIKLIGTSFNENYVLTNLSRENMEYMLGDHFAVRSAPNPEDNVLEPDKGKTFNLRDILKASVEGALFKPEVTSVFYKDKSTKKGFMFSTENFGNFMFWSPGEDAGMFCIEPVTQIPLEDHKYFFGDDSRVLKPSKSAKHSVKIDFS